MTYRKLLDKAKSIIKEYACMKFYDETKPLYLETNTSGIRLGAGILQTNSDTKLPYRYGTRQQHTPTHCICKQDNNNNNNNNNNKIIINDF